MSLVAREFVRVEPLGELLGGVWYECPSVWEISTTCDFKPVCQDNVVGDEEKVFAKPGYDARSYPL